MAKFSGELTGSLVFRQGNTIQTRIEPGLSALNITSSLNITGSQLTFNGTNVIGRIENLEAGSVGISIGPLNRHTGSINTWTGSLNNYTGSINSRLDSLTQSTGSYLTSLPNGLVTSSNQILFKSLSGIPGNILSSSQQVSDLGFITSSDGGVSSYTELTNVPSGILSSSAQLLDLGFVTSSVANQDYNSLTNIPSGIISSSNQLDNLGYATTASLPSTGSLITTASSTLNTITFTQGDGSTFSLTVNTGSGGGVSNYEELTNIPSGILSSSAQLTSLGFVTSSETSSDYTTLTNVPGGIVSSSNQIASLGFITSSDANVAYDGDRVISNADLGDLYNNSFNAGTSGSIQDFLNAVFFPNTAPTFVTTPNQDVVEFAASGSTLLTLSATDAEAQPITFSTSSGYTDDFIRVASNGLVTLNVIPQESSFNTDDRGDGTLAHPVGIQVTDTFGSTTTQTFYFHVNANTAPKFRQTSIGGTVITSFTANRNENASTGEVGKIYFTDDESDTITIESGSDPTGHFSFTKYSNYVQINQVTASLDFESKTFYSMSLTASDEHYQATQDLDAISTIPIVINVTDNVNPTINNQTLSSISENSSNGATVDTISASDSEGDTITFRNFNLFKLELDNVDVSIGTYGGTSQVTDPHENPFQMNSSGLVTRKNGVFINSDLINEYQYTVQVVDSFNSASNQAVVTIPISDDPAPSISTNGTFYIVESATATDPIKINSNGYTGTQGTMSSNQFVTWSTTSPVIAIASGDGRLSVSVNISGSYSGSQTIIAPITASNSFGTLNTSNITVNIVENDAPSLTLTDQGLTSDIAVSGSTAATLSITDIESETPYSVTLSGPSADSFNLVSQNAANSSLLIQPTGSLVVGNYFITASATDTFNKTGTSSITLTVAQAADYGKTYIYTSTRTGGGTLSAGNYNGIVGISTVDSATPPEVQTYTADTTSPFYLVKTGALGTGSITVGGGVMTLRATTSGSNLAANISESFSGNGGTAEQILIFAPSGSDLSGIPTSMTDSTGGSTAGEYVLFQKLSGESSFNASTSTIHKIPLDVPHIGIDAYFAIGRQSAGTFSTAEIRLVPSSGSAPS